MTIDIDAALTATAIAATMKNALCLGDLEPVALCLGEADMTLLAPAAEAGRSSVGALELPVNHRDSRFSAPSPEEGHRLLRSFFSIREPALRDAVIEFVTALALVENRQ